jgi:hypothetical protein
MAKSGNRHAVASELPLSPEEYSSQTKWSDHSVGIPIMFNFYHAVELLLKGFLVASTGESVTGHHLTSLLEKLEKAMPQTNFGVVASRVIRDIPPESPIGRFLSSNRLTIDRWYEALKYPELTSGQMVTHIDLKYGASQELPHWEALRSATEELRTSAVKLACERGYVSQVSRAE